ncbi:MAG: indole-3-glycerol phosphate synthase TrpC [Dehalococcoidia bacterium]
MKMAKTGTILDRIVRVKRQEVARLREQVSLRELEERIASQLPPQSLSRALTGEGTRLIAEVKRASPSRGLLAPDFDPVGLARTYAENGVAAISVLTERPHFQGSLEHLRDIKEALGTGCPPVLRKDFIFDTLQVYESRAWGADAVLLIAAILDQEQMKMLAALSRELGMECLVEVHDEVEVKAALKGGAGIVGINNRDLATFKVDIETTRRLRPLVPEGIPVVAESGIFTREDVARLEGWGVDAILVGEGLITAPDVAAKVRELITPMPAKARPQ